MSMFAKLDKPKHSFLKDEDCDLDILKASLTPRQLEIAKQNYRNAITSLKQVMNIADESLQDIIKRCVIQDILAYKM